MGLWLYLVKATGQERSQPNFLVARTTSRTANPHSGIAKGGKLCGRGSFLGSFFFYSIVVNKKLQLNNGAIVWFPFRTLETAQLAQHLLLKTNPDWPEIRLQVCSDPSLVGSVFFCVPAAELFILGVDFNNPPPP